ncbi:Glycosyl transferase, group 1 family protein [uncultured Candidatus Thioglobus sp.]|nr:Glycosyl transferase, group 1 family protein [uncultured Candidatus Thioglobus sp.]
MNKIKVLHLHFGTDGGAERFFVNLVNAFPKNNLEQKFIIRPNRGWKNEISPLGEVIENNGRRFFLSGLLLKWKIRSIIKEWQPNVIMAWMPRAASFIPNISHITTLVRLGDFPRHLEHFRYCDIIVGNVPDIVKHCQKLGWSGNTKTISNFPREVNPVAVPRDQLNTPEEAFVIVNAGRFVYRKGFDLMIRVAAKIPNSYLWLIGDGTEYQKLKDLAAELNILDRVRFIGWVDEPIHYLASSDVLLMPSRHEPLGNTILEAWQANIPVVSTRSEGPNWYMDNEENGILIDIDDLDAAVNAVNKIKTDANFTHKIKKGGQLKLSEYFSSEKIVEQYIDIFNSKI